MQEVLPNVALVFALVSYLVALGLLVWGIYLAYLATRALRKYLRS